MGYDWIDDLAALREKSTPAVLVTIVSAKGSVPRPPGTRMIVTTDALHGTIGGGHLEFKSIAIAREMLAGSGGPALHRFPLGASLGQCCGGAAQLLFEPVLQDPPWIKALARLRAGNVPCAVVARLHGGALEDRLIVTQQDIIGTLGSKACDDDAIAIARGAFERDTGWQLAKVGGSESIECSIDVLRAIDFHIVLFGAGHVGQALVRTLAGIRCRIKWVDSRDSPFPETVPRNTECIATDSPEAEVAAAPAGAYFLVMTHSHAVDEALAERILTRDDFAYFGLIGSLSKRRQFERRMEARGIPRSRFAAMTCPIGMVGIAGKEPEVIAIAVAAELLQVRSRIALEVGVAAVVGVAAAADSRCA